LIANPSAESGSGSQPANWQKSGSGSNIRAFSWVSGGAQTGNRSLKVTVSNYIRGDAYWSHPAVTAAGSTVYQYSDYYKSNTTSYVMAVLRRANGTVTYTDLRTLPASSSTWRQVVVQVTTPADISTIKVVHLIRSNGWVQTDNFFLGTATTPPPPPPPATGNFRITSTAA
jgi:hypothetical protein